MELSCWEEAVAKLRLEQPRLYAYLEDILVSQPQPRSPKALADNLLTVIDTKIRAIENRELPLPWTVRSADNKARIQRALKVIWKALQVFKTLGDTAANIDPLHAGIAWSGVNIVLQFALNGAEQNAAALEGLAQISPLVARYMKIEELYLGHEDNTRLKKEFKALLIELYTAILQYQVSVAHHFQRSKLVQHVRALPKMDDWSALLNSISSKDAECRKFTQIFEAENQITRHRELEDVLNEQNLQMDMMTLGIKKVNEQNGFLLSQAEYEANMAILKWVSIVVPHQDHIVILETNKLKDEYANAGEWLFRHPKFQDWCTDLAGQSSVLWLCGPVGTGKSSLVCLVIEHFLRDIQSSNSDKGQIAYFYCTKKQGESSGSDPQTILQSLVRQLAWSADNRSINESVRDKYDEAQLHQGYVETRLSVAACVSLLSKLLSSSGNTTIIIDALDECSDPSDILSNLKEASISAKSGTRFFFSSRMNVDVSEEFPECTRIDSGLESQDDIEFYVRTEVKGRKRRLLNGKAPELEDMLVEVLTRRAQGMFKWVQLQLQMFFNPKSPLRHSKDVRRKLEILNEDVRAPKLDAVYDEIYEMNMQYPEDRRIACRALKWILCSSRPLTTEELVEAVSIDSDGTIDPEVDETYVMQICSNLIISDHTGFVQFAHLSVREYLMSRQTMTADEYSDGETHMQVAKTCLIYILRTDISEVNKFEEGGGIRGYAILNWPFHCILAGEERQQDDTLRILFDELMSTEKLHSAFIQWTKLLPKAVRVLYYGNNDMRWRLEKCVSLPPDPCFAASTFGFFEVISSSRHIHLSVERQNTQGQTYLNLASEWGHLEIVKLLLQKGANIDALDSQGYTPLMLSIEKQRSDVTRLLLEKGADVSVKVEKSINTGWTALHFAICHESEEVVELLIQGGADIDARNAGGNTALHIAARQEEIGAVQLLVENGADVKIKNKAGVTAIQSAAISGNDNIVRIVASPQASSDATFQSWIKLAEFGRAVRNGDLHTVQLLLDRDIAHGHTSDSHGVTTLFKTFREEGVLHLAASRGHLGMVALLIQKGEDVNVTDKFGATPLHMAILYNHTEIVRLLLEKGADTEAKDRDGQTALYLAALGGQLDIVKLLLAEGTVPRKVDDDMDEDTRRIFYASQNCSEIMETINGWRESTRS